MSDVSQTIARLRVVADYLARHQDAIETVSYDTAIEAWREANPDRGKYAYPKPDEVEGDVDLSYVTASAGWDVRFTVNGPDSKELTRSLRRALGGKWDKQVSGDSFYLKQRISEELWINATIFVERDAVCVAVKETQEVVVPAQEAQPAKPAVPEHVETQEVVVDWDCGNLLTDDEAAVV